MANATEPYVYLNGQFLPRSQAKLDIEDRGALFADGVYEVVRYFSGRPLAMADHVGRLRESLAAIRLEPHPDAEKLDHVSDELVRRNGYQDATVYWQVSRGSAPRNAAFPKGGRPTVLAISYPAPPLDPQSQPTQIDTILAEDVRWHCCSIKSLMLLGNVLAKNQALDAGADEAILHRGGRVTEGTATSVCIVRDEQLWTHPADRWILDGITRRILLRLARHSGVPVVEKPFEIEALWSASEVMVCGTTKLVASVQRVDQRPIGAGRVGPITKLLYEAMVKYILQACGNGGVGQLVTS